MRFFAAVVKSTGALYSTGETVADPLPRELVAIELPKDYDPDEIGVMWDPSALAFVPIPPAPVIVVKSFDPASIAEIVDDPALALDDALKAKLAEVLKNARFIDASAGVI